MNQKYESDDHSRFAGPEYLDRVSLSAGYDKSFRREDALILSDVQEALMNSSEVDSSDIEVVVEDGVVTLVGRVANREMKKEAEHCFAHIKDVTDVFNLLTLSEFTDMGGEGLVKNQARI